jgi:hypothetical protein
LGITPAERVAALGRLRDRLFPRAPIERIVTISTGAVSRAVSVLRNAAESLTSHAAGSIVYENVGGVMKKRFEHRHAIQCPIEVISAAWDEAVTLDATDLSPRGAYIESALLPDKGEDIVCSFRLDASKTFDFFARVERVNLLRRDGEIEGAGFGVRFLDATPIDRLSIRDRLKKTPPPLPFLRRPPRAGRCISELPPPVQPLPNLRIKG